MMLLALLPNTQSRRGANSTRVIATVAEEGGDRRPAQPLVRGLASKHHAAEERRGERHHGEQRSRSGAEVVELADLLSNPPPRFLVCELVDGVMVFRHLRSLAHKCDAVGPPRWSRWARLPSGLAATAGPGPVP